MPAAIAAPTPVSALVHSSTLVTAGVYLLIRFYYVFEGVRVMCMVMFFFGLITMFIAGMVAVFEVDIRRIIALSTLSQLGMMVMVIGLGGVYLSYFHLVVHALFRALLFLCGGKVIHLFMDEQDFRYMGSVVGGRLVRFVRLSVANFSLCGLPFVSGFYSKDMIIERFGYGNLGLISILVMLFGVMFTFVYRIKFWWLVGVEVLRVRVNNWSDVE